MIDERYSLMRGGMVYRLMRADRLERTERPLAPWVALALLIIVLVPVGMLAARDGTLVGGVQVPLLRDYTVWARFVLCMPLLVLAAPLADERLWRAQRHLGQLVEPQDHDRFMQGLQGIRRWRDSVWPELLLFAIAVASAFTAPPLDVYVKVTSWRFDGEGSTAAGLWLNFVGMPLFRFLVLLWLWRQLLWICLLWQFARVRLALHAAHPDGCAGLSFLGFAQASFIVLPLMGALLVTGSLAMEVEYLQATLHSLRYVLLGYIVLGVAIMVAPLLLLSPRLAAIKRASLLAYGALGTDCAEQFENKWLGRARGGAAPILEAGDSSALADLTGVYATVNGMSTVPLQRFVLIQFALAASAPLLPVVLLTMPIDELLDKLLSSLI
ncbi:hypothetical protein [Lysobacter sp.]|uniref:hypothetical protein n=1 Tax=Lysobacter sp. TaxID=72226 RepID=UPI002D731D80|nr:hypothetical protein [Lysobacter sp.]HZX76644.1 hypothetical protein [Lysobacter sp.]